MATKKPIMKNEEGQRLTKNGSVDKRSMASIENLKKSSAYANIVKAKEGVKEAKKQEAEVNVVESEEEEEEESDEEPEYEIQPKPKPIPIVVEEVKEIEEKTQKLKFVEDRNEIEERTKKWLEEHREATKREKEEMKRQADEEIRLLKEENKKLKGLGAYNDHLSRISHLSRNVSIRF